MPELTSEQRAAVGRGGKCIVSASAGSGKTFVMISKICDFVVGGGDLENVLAITYTQKAAVQMKEKLRSQLIARLKNCDDADTRAHIKAQLNKIAYADVSTVHSFCSRLIRTYFYEIDADGAFDIVGSDDSVGQSIISRASDDLFEELYESDDKDLLHLLKFYRKGRSDASLKKMMVECYEKARNLPDYRQKLASCGELYTQSGFEGVCAEMHALSVKTLNSLIASVENFESAFVIDGVPLATAVERGSAAAVRYADIFAEMRANMNAVADEEDIFAPRPPLYAGQKPRDSAANKLSGESFSAFKTAISRRYNAIYGELEDRETEYQRFISSGETCRAFCNLLLKFDEKFSAAKREEGKLDYSDLEHFALQILSKRDVLSALHERYKRVYVDEFQDVNPVQERIINAVCGGEAFFVGDKKQAIYGFRGSRSSFFDKKIKDFAGGEGSALALTYNFRSCGKVINFVNSLFTEAMNENACDFNYADTGTMRRGGAYPQDCGTAEIDLYGKDEKQKIAPEGVYSVRENYSRSQPRSRQGMAVLQLVKRELSGKIFDLSTGAYRDTRQGDICILTRKRSDDETLGIARTLREAGYSVSGAKEENICLNPEIKQLIDVLSYIDNAEQDIPMCSCMLSGVGGFCEDELARIRIAFKGAKGLSFRACAERYADTFNDGLAIKLKAFFRTIEGYRAYADMTGAGALIDKLCEDAGWEAAYSAGSGEKLKNVRRIQQIAYSGGSDCSLSAFLKALKDGGYRASAPESADSDCIKIMTMHSSKGLEFPVVIIADICASFKGSNFDEMQFDDDYGFAPRWYDEESMLCGTTVLRRLCKMRADREEIKNELNLFYVACTRAMCNLHVLAREIPDYMPADALYAKSYSQLADFSRFEISLIDCSGDIPEANGVSAAIGVPDEAVLGRLKAQFMRAYPDADSVELPVKSSASQIIKLHLDEDAVAVHRLFAEDELPAATGAERGVAYHRFLQLCDFSVKDYDGIKAQIEKFVEAGLMTAEQAKLLSVESAVKILNMSVFDNLSGAETYREREFLCRLEAREFMKTDSADNVLVQGAIDLLAFKDGAARVVDYKFSAKTDEALVATYAPQLALYKKAVARITGIAEENISTTIVNIYRLTEIRL